MGSHPRGKSCMQHHYGGIVSLAMTWYLSRRDLHLDLTASRWHDFTSFSPSWSRTLAMTLPLFSGIPILVICPMKTQGCGWLKRRSEVMGCLLSTSYTLTWSWEAANCFPCMEEGWFCVRSIIWHPLTVSRHTMSISSQTTIHLSYFHSVLLIPLVWVNWIFRKVRPHFILFQTCLSIGLPISSPHLPMSSTNCPVNNSNPKLMLGSLG